MRLRNIPGAKDAIAESIYVIQNPQENKGNWDKVFPQHQPVHLEVHDQNIKKIPLSHYHKSCI